jgi:CBS domain-containing protein
MKVVDIMKVPPLVTIEPGKTVFEAIERLNTNKIGALIVMDGANVVGIITERDVLHECGRRYEQLKQTKVGDAMTKELIVGHEDDDVRFVQYVMTEKRIRHLPIMTGNKLVGLVSIGDVVRALLRATVEEADDLREKLVSHYVVG